MTIDDMRAALGLGPEVSDVDVTEAYAAYLATQVPMSPGEEPVTLAEARTQLQMLESDPTDQDDLIKALIGAARETVEGLTGLILTRQQIVQHADSFDRLRLYAWPVASIDAVIYRDGSDAELVLESSLYRADLSERPVRLRGVSTLPVGREITVLMTAGYTTPADVPLSLKQAILVMVSALFNDRESGDVPGAVMALCRPFMRYTV